MLDQLDVDFDSGPMQALLKSASNQQPLAKAVGLPSKTPIHIFDATAGLMKDSYLLAALGCQVTSVERHPEVFRIVSEALKRGERRDVIERIHALLGDSKEILQKLKGDARPDVVYIDPMYPLSKKSALPKKNMQIFRELIGPDTDSKELFEIAMKTAKARVVIKRPPEAEPLDSRITHSFESKLVRFDMYKV